jgi:DNA-binding MarR family transcriptional regulator
MDDDNLQLQTGLGSLLRSLLERLDGEVERLYQVEEPGFRPKYYPIVRILLRDSPIPLARIAQECGITHSAVSQTVSEMVEGGLVEMRPGKDARERLASLSEEGKAVCARLIPLWTAVHVAAAELDAELTEPLSAVVTQALDALTRRPFGSRIREHLPERPE